MPNNNDILKTLVFIVLATFLVGAVAVTVVASASQADALPPSKLCPPNSPSAGKNILLSPRGCGHILID